MAKKKKKNPNRLKSREQRQINRDFQFGQKMAEKYGLTDPLERLDTATPTAISNLIADAQGAYQATQTRSPEMERFLAMQEAGLSGLTAEENQALRETAMENLNRGFQQAQRQMAVQQAGSGVRGASAAAQAMGLQRQLMGDTRGLERDLLINNIDIQNQRRDAYGELLRGVETDQFNRQKDAFGTFADLVGGNQARTDELNLFNLGQGEKERALAQGGLMGFAGLLDARRQTNISNQLARDALNKPQTAMIGGGGGGFDSAGYVSAMQNLIQSTNPALADRIGAATGQQSSGGGI